MKPELLLPAGNLEKLRFALMYGADAVYIGGKIYSLRAQASNFTLDDIEEGVKFAHSLNKKVYVTVNVIPREKEMNLLKDYLISLEKVNVDGIIVSSPSILECAKENTSLHVSVSTQASISNSSAVKFYQKQGADRVVLARELSMDEIKTLSKNTDCEIEVFIHGGMCSAWSGRCTLSNYMSGRDANGGGCAHSCRWIYDIYQNDEKINTEPFKIGSKDLSSIHYIKDMCEANVTSLKVEGRMKSVSYVATVAYTYRKLIDDIYDGSLKDDDYYLSLLGEQVNREASTGFLDHGASYKQTLYSAESSPVTQGFYGVVMDYNDEKKEALIEVRNRFSNGDTAEILSPGKEPQTFIISGMNSSSATHAMEIVSVHSDIKLNKYDIIRRKQWVK